MKQQDQKEKEEEDAAEEGKSSSSSSEEEEEGKAGEVEVKDTHCGLHIHIVIHLEKGTTCGSVLAHVVQSHESSDDELIVLLCGPSEHGLEVHKLRVVLSAITSLRRRRANQEEGKSTSRGQ